MRLRLDSLFARLVLTFVLGMGLTMLITLWAQQREREAFVFRISALRASYRLADMLKLLDKLPSSGREQLAAIATAAKNPPGVVAYVNFAGGTGGDGTRAPEHSCDSPAMEALMRTLGRSNHVAGLWLYAQNDRYWGSQWPRTWYRAFSEGNAPTQFVMTDAVPGSDGHQLLARGGQLWAPALDAFLSAHGW